MESEGLWTTEEAAKELGISPRTLGQWRWYGKHIPFKKIGGCVRYDPAVIREFKEGATRQRAEPRKRTGPVVAMVQPAPSRPMGGGYSG